MELSKLIVLGVIVSSPLAAFAEVNQNHVIYGNDDRKDLYEITNPAYVALSQSTVALMKASDLTQNSSGMLMIHADPLIKRLGVCKTEAFATQPSGAFCSGSLIGRNLILTAGHCIIDQEECNTTRFVFGYDVNQKGNFPNSTQESEVYSCKSIIHREQNGTGADFGIIEMDREVVGHEPLKLADRSNSCIEKNAKLLMIGHPSGLPTKLDDGGTVRDPNPNGYFVATTDSYGGNSGSAVINLSSQLVEGVLVRGESDFVAQGACKISKVCAPDACRGEDVTKISSVSPFIPAR